MGQFSFASGKAMTSFQGYLLDMDDEYYYLGTSADAIDIAFDRKTIYSVQVIQPTNQFKQMLDEMDMPEEEHEIN